MRFIFTRAVAFVPHLLRSPPPLYARFDTRFACARLNIFPAFPDNGPMPWVSNWQEFATGLFRRLSYTTMTTASKIALGHSPQPGLWHGVVRWVMDTPLHPDHAINMAGLIQARIAHWLLTEHPFKPQEQDYLLQNSTVQACRHGLRRANRCLYRRPPLGRYAAPAGQRYPSAQAGRRQRAIDALRSAGEKRR